MKAMNPDGVVKPASNYAQCVVHSAGAERIVISGQVGTTLDGKTADGLEAQTVQTFENIFSILKAAGYEREHLVRIIAYVTVPGQVAIFRDTRDRVMGGHLCCSTYIEVSGLASPQWLVEIEAEAIKE